jgi:hypothetical protein
MREEFTIGNVLSTGFKVWLKNIVPFFLITAIIYSPVIIWGSMAAQGELDFEKIQGITRFSAISGGLLLVLNYFVGAALTFGVVKQLQGERASIGACFVTGLKRFFPVLGVSLLAALATGIAMIALIVPGLIVGCMLYVSTPASVIEKPGLIGALKRSHELTQGHKSGIFGLMIVLYVIGFALQKVVEKVMFDPQRLESTLRPYLYADMARQVIVGSLSAVMVAVAYYYLRSSKDGTSASELARVFE